MSLSSFSTFSTINALPIYFLKSLLSLLLLNSDFDILPLTQSTCFLTQWKVYLNIQPAFIEQESSWYFTYITAFNFHNNFIRQYYYPIRDKEAACCLERFICPDHTVRDGLGCDDSKVHLLHALGCAIPPTFDYPISVTGELLYHTLVQPLRYSSSKTHLKY